jgi:hypothetical protein
MHLVSSTSRFSICGKLGAADHIRRLRTTRAHETAEHQVPLLYRRVCDLHVVWCAVPLSTIQVELLLQ